MTDETSALHQVIGLLGQAVADLRVAVAELKVTVASAADRDREDRLLVATHESRISTLERWRSRVSGQLVLISFIAGGTAIGLIGAVVRHYIG